MGKKSKKIFSKKSAKYIITLLIFVIWMLFFDNNSLRDQMSLRQTLGKLAADTLFYKQKAEEFTEYNRLLMGDMEELEMLARSKYKMKREDEDVYILVTEDSEHIEKE